MAPNTVDDEVAEEHLDYDDVSVLLKELLEHRKERRVKEADIIKKTLWNKHSIQVFYRRDGTIGWNKVSSQCGEETVPAAVKRVGWSNVMNVGKLNADSVELSSSLLPTCSSYQNIPLIIATVNSPYYRTRLSETMESLSHHASFDDGTRFAPITPVDMLNLSDNPCIGTHRILYEGWRQILLPKLLSSPEYNDQSIILVAEDDLRLCNSISPGRITELCSLVLDANPDLLILSLGHAYSATKPRPQQRRCMNKRDNHICDPLCSDVSIPQPTFSLLTHVTSGKGLHGTTLLGLRHPEGTQSLLNAMEHVPYGKRCHLDQFLFKSKLHNIGLGLSEPPLVGWAEVSETLTSVGAGCRRNGGGRLGQLPEVSSDEIKWVRRYVSETQCN
ncbi:hypothetical protein ACHAWU_006612 [Discostella pseudostelligera]|uniref:Uncharacterized protein n=1 Tax=Discostella pseudostelligera TaxID=259834 RepID=A0ABD3MBQ7_9STRA